MLDQKRILSLLTQRFLELIILPTEQCNFRCVYCYEDFAIGRMKPEIVKAIKKLIARRFSGLDALKISWFGGEPLLAKNIIYEISDHVQELQKTYPHVQCYSGMTTNGFQLNEDLLRKLVRLGISTYQVSLDGTEEVHDKTRIRANGVGTFREIWRNLLAARDSDLVFSIILRIHVTPENVLDLYELIDNIKAAFGYDARFTLFFKAIENLGGAGNSFPVLCGKEKEVVLEKLYEMVGNTLKINKIDGDQPYICYAAQANSFLIRADGKIGKCTVAFDDERNVIGELREDGTVSIQSDQLALWTRGIKSLQAEDLSCPLHHMPKAASFRSIPVVAL